MAATALATYTTDATQAPPLIQDAGRLSDDAIMVPAGQLSEWMLDDLQDETSPAPG